MPKGGSLNVFALLDVQYGCLRSYTAQGKVDTAQVIDWLDDFAKSFHWLRPEDFECQQALHERINYILTRFQMHEFELDFLSSKSNMKC